MPARPSSESSSLLDTQAPSQSTDPAHASSSSYGTMNFLRKNKSKDATEDKTLAHIDSHDSQNGQGTDHEAIAGLDSSATLYEKKCMIVNHEIDRIGMGRYQWCIFGLCGFGYLLDLMWAQAFGLILGPLQQEFGFDGRIYELFE